MQFMRLTSFAQCHCLVSAIWATLFCKAQKCYISTLNPDINLKHGRERRLLKLLKLP